MSEKEKRRLGDALLLVQLALIEKYGTESQARIMICGDGISLDDDDSCVIVENGTPERVVKELIA